MVNDCRDMKIPICLAGMAAIAARGVFGLTATEAIFVFFPILGAVRGIFNNDGYRIARNAVVLVLYPFVLALSSRLFNDMLYPFAVRNGWAMSDAASYAGIAVAMAVSMLAAFVFASIVANFIGQFSLPRKLHSIVSRGLEATTVIALLFGGIAAIRYCDAKFFPIPLSIKAILAVTLCSAAIFSLWRTFLAFTQTKETPSDKAKSAKANARAEITLSTIPSLRLSDVAGLEDVKAEIMMRVVEPLKNPALARRYGLRTGGGLLLYGPPGTGKTFIAKAIAGELALPFFSISAASIFNKFVGETEKKVREIFKEIRQHKMSIVFMDELETIFPVRSMDVHETTRKVVSILLQELDGVDANKNPMLLIGATNLPWMVDSAFLRPGRFDVRLYVGYPDIAARRHMVRRLFAEGEIPSEKGLDEYIAFRTEGCSGADIKGFSEMLRQYAFIHRLKKFSRADANAVFEKFHPSRDDALDAKIKAWSAGKFAS